MMRVVANSVLVVPPFECAWLAGDGLQFPEKGSGCVTFEAQAANDVTVVFKEDTALRHYRTDDPGRIYTVVLGSHRNRRLRIEVDGNPVVDTPGKVVKSFCFERYWINVSNGTITVGKGEPGTDVFMQWEDPQPNLNVQYVGLSSWDKHVGYKSIKVLPPYNLSKAFSLEAGPSIEFFLKSGQFADEVLAETHKAHRIILESCCNYLPTKNTGEICTGVLSSEEKAELASFLRFVYTGQTKVAVSQIRGLQNLAARFGCEELEHQCRCHCEEQGDFRGAEGKGALVELVLSDSAKERLGWIAKRLHVPVNTQRLAHFLDTGAFSDVVLRVDGVGEGLHAHRVILSAWSTPLARMFCSGMLESNSLDVCIGDVGIDTLKAMLLFMYRGELEAFSDDDKVPLLVELLMLADRCHIEQLIQECMNRLFQRLTEDNACAILCAVLPIPACQALQVACEESCAKNFDFCTAPPAFNFRDLDSVTISRLLQHPQLWVSSEERVMDALALWAADRNDVGGWEDACRVASVEGIDILFASRRSNFEFLLQLVRFPLMPLHLLHKMEASILGQQIDVLRELLWEAMEYLEQDGSSASSRKSLLALGINKQGHLVRQKSGSLRLSRRLSAYRELLYMWDGDHYGVCHYVGTAYGTQPWMNPVLTKRLSVLSSSPSSRFTDPKLLVSRNFQGTLFAGPGQEAGKLSTWWLFDFGKDHRLTCNYYTLRQDGSNNYVRSWSLEGSVDGVAWVELRRHEDDHTLCRPGQYASWPVLGAQAFMPCRYVRICMHGPSSSHANPWNLCLCNVEFYGYFL